MRFLMINLCYTIDSVDLGTLLDLQDAFMERFMKEPQDSENERCYEAMDPFEAMRRPTPCDLDGITCSGGLIRELKWSTLTSYLIVSMDWIPPTCSKIDITSKRISLPVETARLPRDLKLFLAISCELHGELNLQTLPPRMVDLVLSQNNFHGEINLLYLPSTMEHIDLNDNMFQSLIWDSALLPKYFRMGYFIDIRGTLKHIPIGERSKNDSRIAWRSDAFEIRKGE